MPIKRDDSGRALIDSTHPDYDAFADRWDYIDRVITGRGVRQEILTLNPSDTSEENRLRNYQYKERAVFSRIAGRTVNRMIGLAFSKYPTMTVPAELDYVKSNVDGAGASIYQQSQAALKSVVAKGRAGLLVEYPIMTEEASRFDMAERGYYATIQRFEPQQILNWSLMRNGAKMQLGSVTLKDTVEWAPSDGPGARDCGAVESIRELSMEYAGDGSRVYVSRLWRRAGGGWAAASEHIPLDGYGRPWREIPFAFIGSETNQPRVDDPPMYDICEGNVCHYRLHADYMDSVHFVGQPQGYVTGAPDAAEFVENMKSIGWYAGARQFVILPPGGSVAFASVPPNTMVKEAMDSMRDTLTGMGAFFLMPGSVVKTATQAEGEQEEQHSILSLAAANVSEAYTACLAWMCRYMRVETAGRRIGEDGGIADDAPVYDLRRDFIKATAGPQMIDALWRICMQGGIPKSDFWQNLRKLEIIDGEKTDEDIKNEIEGDAANDGGLNLDAGDDGGARSAQQ